MLSVSLVFGGLLFAGAARGDFLISQVRPIQLDYPSETGRPDGELVVFWEIDEPFDQVQIFVDGEGPIRILRGDFTSVGLGRYAPGAHLVTVEGLVSGKVESASSSTIDVLDAPPVPGVLPDGCLFYSYDPASGGFLEFFWKNRDSPEIPYVDFGISFNGLFVGFLEAPAGRLRFSGVMPGLHSIEVVAYTFNHICSPGVIECLAEKVDPVLDPACRLHHCEEGSAVFQIYYTLPQGPSLDGVAVFDISAGGSGVLLGTFPPEPPISLLLSEPGDLTVELSAFHGDSASNIPAVAEGSHAVTSCLFSGDECSVMRFIRSDCNGDLQLDITDDIFLLGYMFIGGKEPGCHPSCDFTADDVLDLTDVIAGLSFKFLKGNSPPAPYPRCGPDPQPGKLECRVAPFCGE